MTIVIRSRVLGLCCALLFVVSQAAAQSNPYILLGPSDGLALDQPRVAVEFFKQTTPAQSMGPEIFNTFLLDTGASGIVVVGPALTEMQTHGYQTVADYDEQGVAGFTTMGVSAQYDLDFAGTSGIRNSIGNVRALSNSQLNFGGFGGILGMPAMVGRTTTIDMTPWANLTDLFLYNEFSTAPPTSAGHRYSVPLRLYEFPLTGQHNPNDPLPTSEPLPFVSTLAQHGNRCREGEMILDTGAQLSVLSSAAAFDLGLDADGDGTFDQEKLFDIEVGGIGGFIEVPVVELNRLSIHTNEGIDLALDGMAVAIIDIDPSIDGVFGMDNLTSGWISKVLLGGGEDGYYRYVHFDFRNAANLEGTMLVDLTPQYDVVRQPTPIAGDGNGDGMVSGADYTIWADNFGLHNGTADPSTGDYNGDGFVTGADYTTWADHFGLCVDPLTAGVSEDRLEMMREYWQAHSLDVGDYLNRFGGHTVPEPSTLWLAAAGMGMLFTVLRAATV